MSTLESQGRTALAIAADLPEIRRLDQGFSKTAEALFPQLHALNLEFLRLTTIGCHPVETHCGPMGLPATVADSLCKMPEWGLNRMAQCPNALFDLSFDDVPRWTELCCSSPEVATAKRVTTDSRIAHFVTSALFLVWHSIQIDRMFSRFAFGIRDATSFQLKRLTVTDVAQMAPRTAGWLTARWVSNPCFWPDLLRGCAANSPLQLQITMLMGCQLLAASLDSELQMLANSGSRPTARK